MTTRARQTELLNAAAVALTDGRDPMVNPFLSEHGVTLDECYDLADQLAIGATFMAWAIEHPDLAATAFRAALEGMHLQDVLARLSRTLGEPA